MTRARGVLRSVSTRRGRGRPRGTSSGSAGDTAAQTAEPAKVYRGRGRPRKHKQNEDEQKEQITCLKFPVTEKDDNEVECKLCKLKTSFREFRIHNLQTHSNIATTSDDPTIPEHKFYERKLKELARLTKAVRFCCPVCEGEFKSTLGLAYHLETCGKTKEEIESCLTKCDQCDEKFTLPNLAWHKKAKHSIIKQEEYDDTIVPSSSKSSTLSKRTIEAPLGKRKSAMKARKVMEMAAASLADDTEKMSLSSRKRKSKIDKDDEEWDASTAEENSLDGKSIDSLSKSKPQAQLKIGSKGSKTNSAASSGKGDFNSNAANFIRNLSSSESYWDPPLRIEKDILHEIEANAWNIVPPELIKEYLPKQSLSVPFKTEVETVSHPASRENTITSDYRRLPWFTGEVIDTHEGNLVFNVGGPVYGMSWHPSGKLLAISTGMQSSEELDYKKTDKRKGCIQIYSHNYENNDKGKCGQEESKPIINHLTLHLIICSDYGCASNLQWGSLWPKSLDLFSEQNASFSADAIRTDSIGYLASSFENGDLRIYSLRVEDLEKESNFSFSGVKRVPVYNKVPEIRLRQSVYKNTGQICRFDWHEQNALLIAGYCSGVVALFNLETQSKLLRETILENGHNVVLVSPFWVFQAHVSPLAGVHFDPMKPRYFATASKDRYLKFWDLDFRQETECRKVGLVGDTCWIRGWMHVAVAVDASISNLSSQHNFVRFYQSGHAQGRSNCASCMNISSLTFRNGITIQATEHGHLTATYFDYFWRECDYDRNKKKSNVVNICKINVDPTSFTVIKSEDFPKTDESYAPFEFKDEEPRIILTFFKERIRSQLKEPSAQSFEDYVRFASYLRINKVSWCPIGRCFATGYRSGLLTIVPASFKSLYG